MQAKYAIKVQVVRSKTQAPRFHVNFPLPLAAAIGLRGCPKSATILSNVGGPDGPAQALADIIGGRIGEYRHGGAGSRAHAQNHVVVGHNARRRRAATHPNHQNLPTARRDRPQRGVRVAQHPPAHPRGAEIVVVRGVKRAKIHRGEVRRLRLDSARDGQYQRQCKQRKESATITCGILHNTDTSLTAIG